MRPLCLLPLLACTAPPAAPAAPPSDAARLPTALPAPFFVETKLQASTPTEGAYYGSDVARAGDLDGDGFDDILVSTPWHDSGGSSLGAVYVYRGSATGIDPSTELQLLPPADAPEDGFGTEVAGVGDLNGDGYDDIAVGADKSYGPTFPGLVYVYYGSPTGLPPSPGTTLVPTDGLGDDYGSSVAGAGDLNGDGYDDLVVGANYDDTGGVVAGAAYVYYGAATGVDPASETKLFAPDGADYDGFGLAVAGAGDLDGDGYDDLAIASPFASAPLESGGAVYIAYGSAAGVGAPTVKLAPADPEVFSIYGREVASAGDLNGDGYGDLVVGSFANGDNGWNSGTAYVYYGSATGVDPASEQVVEASDGLEDEFFGSAVAGGVDLDADGFDDVVLGAAGAVNGSFEGAVYVYYGSPTGLDVASERRVAASDALPDQTFGDVVAGVGDTNGDGFDDVLVGAPWDNDPVERAGAAYVLDGRCRDDDGDGFCREVDCDDQEPTTYPGAPEVVADEVDQDCDGGEICYRDDDGDAASDGTVPSDDADCADPGETTSVVLDCDDTDPTVYLGAEEVVANGVDEDCDGMELCYADLDDDAHADEAGSLVASDDVDCTDPGEAGADVPRTDCDDNDPATNPGVSEDCTDPVDRDCDGDPGYADDDGDGFAACEDCDDADRDRSPGRSERCNGLDDDCDGTVDDDPVDGIAAYADADGDGYGDPNAPVFVCEPGPSTTDDGTDCNDADPGVNPGATEVPGDGIDNDCNGGDATDDDAQSKAGGCGCAAPGAAGGPFSLLGLAVLAWRRRTC